MQSIVHLQTTAPDTSPPQAEVDVCPLFQVIYLHDDAEHSVTVVEKPSLELPDLLQWVLQGGSVFISCKPP